MHCVTVRYSFRGARPTLRGLLCDILTRRARLACDKGVNMPLWGKPLAGDERL